MLINDTPSEADLKEPKWGRGAYDLLFIVSSPKEADIIALVLLRQS